MIIIYIIGEVFIGNLTVFTYNKIIVKSHAYAGLISDGVDKVLIKRKIKWNG